MTDKEAEDWIIENGDTDDYLLCKAAVELGSTWPEEQVKLKEHLDWLRITGGYPDLR